LKVTRLGDKTFEQAAGFLRIADGENPLDASAVHPEAYPVVERILQTSSRPITRVIGDRGFLRTLEPNAYTNEHFGLPTVKDILAELEKPGRDPRPEFKTALFQDGVEQIGDLQPGMVLEGVVTNITNFGAFVDVGVHQDGLVHISAMSEQFVKDPRDLVKTGDLVKVKVMAVDVERKRIGLSLRLSDDPDQNHRPQRGGEDFAGGRQPQAARRKQKQQGREAKGALADALNKAGLRRL
jgi:uncharacterized protein